MPKFKVSIKLSMLNGETKTIICETYSHNQFNAVYTATEIYNNEIPRWDYILIDCEEI